MHPTHWCARGLDSTGALLLLIQEQRADRNAKGESDSGDVSKRRIPARRFDAAEIRAVYARLFRESLLRPALLLTQGSNPNSEPPDDDVFGFQPFIIESCRL